MIEKLNKQYPIGTKVTTWEGQVWTVKSEWSTEKEWFGAWVECNNHTIWITSAEIRK
jgi:hypothetical protein